MASISLVPDDEFSANLFIETTENISDMNTDVGNWTVETPIEEAVVQDVSLVGANLIQIQIQGLSLLTFPPNELTLATSNAILGPLGTDLEAGTFPIPYTA